MTWFNFINLLHRWVGFYSLHLASCTFYWVWSFAREWIYRQPPNIMVTRRASEKKIHPSWSVTTIRWKPFGYFDFADTPINMTRMGLAHFWSNKIFFIVVLPNWKYGISMWGRTMVFFFRCFSSSGGTYYPPLNAAWLWQSDSHKPS